MLAVATEILPTGMAEFMAIVWTFSGAAVLAGVRLFRPSSDPFPKMVMNRMHALSHHLDVLWTVIKSVLVDVMGHLVRKQVAAKFNRSNHAMLQMPHVWLGNFDEPVSMVLYAASYRTVPSCPISRSTSETHWNSIAQ